MVEPMCFKAHSGGSLGASVPQQWSGKKGYYKSLDLNMNICAQKPKTAGSDATQAKPIQVRIQVLSVRGSLATGDLGHIGAPLSSVAHNIGSKKFWVNYDKQFSVDPEHCVRIDKFFKLNKVMSRRFTEADSSEKHETWDRETQRMVVLIWTDCAYGVASTEEHKNKLYITGGITATGYEL
jgi:hypothetical protein